MENPHHILLVDDEIGNLTFLSRFLKLKKFSVATAHNGKEAIEEINKCVPDVMILDIMMPVMDGMDTLKWVKENQPNIQVIMLSAMGDNDLKVKALQLGALSYISKPMDLTDLQSKIQLALKVKESTT
ncbi:MAG: response regulator [Nitrospinales bacterium]